jgi:hypothetical protein
MAAALVDVDDVRDKRLRTMEISKKFAFNYCCSAKHIHEFSTENQRGFYLY